MTRQQLNCLMNLLRGEVDASRRPYIGDLVERAFGDYLDLLEPLREADLLKTKEVIKEVTESIKSPGIEVIMEVIQKACNLIEQERIYQEQQEKALWQRIMNFGIEGIYAPMPEDPPWP